MTQVVILAGGLGTRLAEETDEVPKPMVRIGEEPMIWHIMRHYAKYGLRDFIICAGYKSEKIKEYFSQYRLRHSDLHFDYQTNEVSQFSTADFDWRVRIVDTGHETQTGGRLLKVADYLDETFMLTYGDGLSDVDLTAEFEFHKSHSGLVTVLAVRPPSRFAVLEIEDSGKVSEFREKPEDEVGWVNGGYMICEPEALSRIESIMEPWERAPMESLAKSSDLFGFKHEGFWQPVDNLRDLRLVNSIWDSGKARW